MIIIRDHIYAVIAFGGNRMKTLMYRLVRLTPTSSWAPRIGLVEFILQTLSKDVTRVYSLRVRAFVFSETAQR